MNQVALIGRITKDPVLRELGNNRLQTSFVIAINRNYKNLKGEVDTDFILCSLWGKLAENTAGNCGKGSLISVSGRIQSRSYEREDGSRVYVTEVIGEEVRFLSKKKRSDDNLYGDTVLSSQSDGTAKNNDENEHFHLPKVESNKLPIM